MSYQLIVEFGAGKAPSGDEIRKFVREFDPNFSSSDANSLRIVDPYTGDAITVELGSPEMIKLEVPYLATFRAVAAAYALAWAFADKLGGTLRDPQLGGPPSLDLARLEWRKHATGGLARIFGGTIPGDLKTNLSQRRGLLRQEIEIRGDELEISRKWSGRSLHYFIPILSLRSPQENTVPNPLGVLTVFVGLFIIIAAGIVGPPLGGMLFVVAIVVIPSSLVMFYKVRRRRLLVFPGQGGNLLLETASPSKRDVEQFLSSIDRVRFALSRPQPRKPSGSSESDSESMRVT